MIKHELRELGFNVEERTQKPRSINLLWLILTLSMIAVTYVGFMFIIGYSPIYRKNFVGHDAALPDVLEIEMDVAGVFYSFIFLLVTAAIYFALKLVLTFFFCSDKYKSIKLKVLEGKYPVCYCKEALKIWQTIVIYLTPVVIIYGSIVVQIYNASVEAQGRLDFGSVVMLFFMSFIMCFDLVPIFYILRVKNKCNPDYISIDHHIFTMSLFKASYVKFGGNKKAANEAVKKRHMEIKTEYKNQKQLFKSMTTCINLRCEKYGAELDDSKPMRCPSCGKRKRRSVVFTEMKTCLNRDCEYFGYELEENLELCSLCGRETGNIALKAKPGLTQPAIAASVISTVTGWLLFWNIGYENGGESVIIVGLFALSILVYMASIVMGVLSKNKRAIVTTIVSIWASWLITGLIYHFFL